MMLHNRFKPGLNRGGGGGGGQTLRPLATLPAVPPLLALLTPCCRGSNQRPAPAGLLAEAGYVWTLLTSITNRSTETIEAEASYVLPLLNSMNRRARLGRRFSLFIIQNNQYENINHVF